MGTLAYVGLGSNLGRREEQIAAALEELSRAAGVRLLRSSALVESAPQGGPPQGDYLNGVAEVEVDLPARELLSLLLEIERRLGRTRRARWGPRVIDLDLLLYGDEVCDGPGLALPHPRMREREFVLGPLAELAGDLAVPPDDQKVAELLEELRRRRR